MDTECVTCAAGTEFFNSKFALHHGGPVYEIKILRANTFCARAPNDFGFPVWNLLHVILLVPRILRWLFDYWKNLWSPDLHGS
jgi:hypothetical protein